ncbi:uncharacterized protein LOC135145699 isoform X2 [Zophobas morio]|uniref:uncharacterized protein LOC135145699 isoform X2 n=1 Tax=Zophobas morio TaxID=2755281 RepID=UPI003083C4F6
MLRMLVVCIAPPHTECFGVPRQLVMALSKTSLSQEQESWRTTSTIIRFLSTCTEPPLFAEEVERRLLGCSTGFPESKCPHSSRSYVRLTESLFELDLLQEGLFAADIAPHNYHNRAELILRLR